MSRRRTRAGWDSIDQSLPTCSILAADTLWISDLHDAQIRVMTSQLSRTAKARIHVVAGMHSGRHCVRAFFDRCRVAGLCVERAREWDRLEGKWSDSELQWVHRQHRQSGSGMDMGARTSEEEEPELEEGTEESRRRWLLCVDLRWKDLKEQ